MLGGVVNVSADNVTRRIFVITDANFQTYQGSGLAVHAWYTDESGDLFSQGNENEKMATIANFNPSGATGLWMKDITFDASKTIKFFVYKYGDTGWHSSDNTQQTLSSSSNMTYYSWASDDNGDLTSGGTVTYSAYLYDGSSWTQQALSCDDHYTFTATIDNETSYNSALQVIIAPSIAFLSDLSSAKWDIMYRPNSENQTVGFSNQTNYGGGSWKDNSNSLKLNAAAHYNLTFYPYGWTYSIAPYFTKTITSASYATFASDYAVAIPDGVTASYATGVSGNVLDMTDFEDGIPANTGALLYKAGGGTVTFTPASSTDEVSGNWFVRGGGTTISQTDGVNKKTNYILTTKTVSGTKTIGFYKANSDGTNTVATDKAYLSIPDAYAPARGYLTFGEDETTSIESLKETKTVDAYYNLNGQRINQPTKGLYIVNGKKVVIK